MTPTIIHTATERRLVADTIACLDLSKPWAVTIEPYKKKRTLSQNDLMWVWNTIIAKETGNDIDVVHETMKKKFLPPNVVNCFGETVDHRTTTTLNTSEMSEYLDKMRALASEMGIVLPLLGVS